MGLSTRTPRLRTGLADGREDRVFTNADRRYDTQDARRVGLAGIALEADLVYRPGDLAEVDFFEVLVDVDGARSVGDPTMLTVVALRPIGTYLYGQRSR